MTQRKVPELTSALGFQVTRLALLFRRRLMRALAQWEVTPEQWQVLAAVVEYEPKELSQSDLADLTLKDRHSISRMIDRMERDGWLNRRPLLDDARTYALRPTVKARREVARMRAALLDDFRTAFARVDPARRALLAELVGEMTTVFESEEL